MVGNPKDRVSLIAAHILHYTMLENSVNNGGPAIKKNNLSELFINGMCNADKKVNFACIYNRICVCKCKKCIVMHIVSHCMYRDTYCMG